MLNETNESVKHKIISKLNRITGDMNSMMDLKENLGYLYPSGEESGELKPFLDIVKFSNGIYYKVVSQSELFDDFYMDIFQSTLPDHNLSQENMNTINALLDTSIPNAKTNRKLIEKNFEDENFEKMVKAVEMIREPFESEMQQLVDKITQLEQMPRDEAIIKEIKSTNIPRIIEMSGQIHELALVEFERENNAFSKIYKSCMEMTNTQKPLIEFIKIQI